MPSFSKIAFFLFIICLPACTVYDERQTEAVSQVVYATKDSIDKARFDLADNYINETTRLIHPPKKRIVIESLMETTTKVSAKENKNVNKSIVQPSSVKTPVIIIPERLRGLKVIVVNSEEYAKLMQDKEAHEQLKIDHANLQQAKDNIDKELIIQAANRNKMVKEINLLKDSISIKNAAIFKLSLTCLGLGASLIAGVILRIKGIL